MNYIGILSIYKFELERARRTFYQTIFAPILLTILYFIIFGSAIGERVGNVNGINYGAFIIPGLIMLNVLGQSIANASFGIYFPRYSGTIYEILTSPLSGIEITIGYISASTTKSVIIGLLVLLTANFFVDFHVKHPVYMIFFLFIIGLTFSLLGFIIGIWADGFDKLQMITLLIVNPLTFLGGSFYSINMLPGIWRQISLFNPVVYLMSGFRWSFYENGDINPYFSLIIISIFLIACVVINYLIFKTGYKLKK